MYVDMELWGMVAVIVLLTTFLVIRIRKAEKKEGQLRSITSRKRRLVAVIIVGSLSLLVVFLASIANGAGMYDTSISETFSYIFSAIAKGGTGLTMDERIVYHHLLPKALGAMAVGIGLATAGVLFQAVIRNPLVDPYITGVSSGAGFAAIWGMIFGSWFGFMSGSVFMIPIMAIIGGLAAFGATMLIAEKSGGTAVNYVLGGVIVGFALGAMQTLLLSFAPPDGLQRPLFWLFGSFSRVTWDNVAIIILPVLIMAAVSLTWARKLNLVLLGEDQARQMGMNVRKFNITVLIAASMLTAICVAFVGIIGFVGLVVPHICRMILGGDHRFVLPASFVIGGILMLFADFLARAFGPVLPVGAITALIGAPLFAYLLIKKGRMYDG
ncbi:MAG: iron ABC transporter permease [Methanomassiliicoccaceae archaeon]|nr:iron ABC transporter permease [Methanomassiliicoccaceae archaeon]